MSKKIQVFDQLASTVIYAGNLHNFATYLGELME